jgi:hypothetical protein
MTQLQYIVLYDRQPVRVGVIFDNPVGGTSDAAMTTDDTDILAKVEELNALVAQKLELTRAPAEE